MRGAALYLIVFFVCVGCSRHDALPPDDAPPQTVLFEKQADSSDSEAYVQGCVEKLPHGAGEATKAKTLSVAPRSLSDGRYHWSTNAYELRVEDGKLIVATSLLLEYPGADDGVRELLRERMREVQTCMTRFFFRHGLTLQLSYATEAKALARPVAIREMGQRVETYNMLNWAFGINGLVLDMDSACTTMTHELGHMLGLFDEYLVPGTQRTLGENDSIMRHAHCPAEFVKFYPRHLRTMLEPICR